MTEACKVFCVDIVIGSEDEEHEVTLYVRAQDGDTLNDITRNYEGIFFCQAEDSAVPDGNIDYELPKDRIDLINHLRQLTQGF